MTGQVVRVGVQAVLQADGRYLFVQRAAGFGRGLWCFPGGHLEPGETLTECALRELSEETSIVGEAGDLAAITDPNPMANHHMQVAVWVREWSGTPKVVDQSECLDVQFLRSGDLGSQIFPPTREILDKLQSGRLY